MLPKAGQTAGPNRLKFFVDTHGGLEADRLTKLEFLKKKFFFHGQRRVLQLVINTIRKISFFRN